MDIEHLCIEGSPDEIAREVFTALFLPVLRQAQASGLFGPTDMACMYAGFIGAALGAAAAQFGKEEAAALGRLVLEGFDAANLKRETH